MSYSRKQWLYAVYMLNQFGIKNESFIYQYLTHLSLLYGKMEQFNTRWHYSVSACIDLLKDELELKKNINQIEYVKDSKTNIRATDLGNFNYCSASYVINKSFVIEKPNGEVFTKIGTELHEKLLLLNQIKPNNEHSEFNEYRLNLRIEAGLNSPLLKKISNSTLVFAGHLESKIFINNNENYSGSPDYIFQDELGEYFVVEEKFHFKRDPSEYTYDESNGLSDGEASAKNRMETWKNLKIHFFENHRVQLISYIKNITEYDIKYGYLLYWFYDISDNIPFVHRDDILEIKLDEQNNELYNKTKSEISILQSNKIINFNVNKLNPKKCAGCVVNKYCAHKSGKFNELKFPYDVLDLNLSFVPFPEELKRTPPSN